MLYLIKLRVKSLESMIDFFQTRFYQIKNYIHEFLWKVGMCKKIPPMELDLTAMIDAAEKQNNLREILK